MLSLQTLACGQGSEGLREGAQLPCCPLPAHHQPLPLQVHRGLYSAKKKPELPSSSFSFSSFLSPSAPPLPPLLLLLLPSSSPPPSSTTTLLRLSLFSFSHPSLFPCPPLLPPSLPLLPPPSSQESARISAMYLNSKGGAGLRCHEEDASMQLLAYTGPGKLQVMGPCHPWET